MYNDVIHHHVEAWTSEAAKGLAGTARLDRGGGAGHTAGVWQRSFLVASGQAWSFWLGSGLLAASLAGYAGAQFSADTSVFVWCLLTALGTSLTGFWFLLAHPRCPACRLRWVFHIASRAGSDVAFARVLEIESCPRCGFPNPTPEPSPGGP
jgi:hypothetical protein